MMGIFSKLFVILSASLGLFVSGLDLLERFDVDVNAWLRGIPPVIATVPERYGDWVDQFVRERLAAPQSTQMAAPSAMQAPGSKPDDTVIVEQARPADRDTAGMMISAGVAVMMALILALMSRGLFRRE
ncbi:hypothetical protein [Maricaulis sp.]|uniref:hypothetical protein n=1 Tax=Maricaulis sp. TaxID=1486257 RepID=UPI003A8DE8F5